MLKEDRYKVRISNQARLDAKDIVLYIKNVLKEPNSAKKYARLIKKEIDSLEYLPHRFAVIDDEVIKDLKLRKLVLKKYIIFYRIDEDKKSVNVDRIIYGASDWINKL